MVSITNPNDKNLKNISVKHPMGMHNSVLIMMADHSTKSIGSIVVGDIILLGGKVTNIIKDKSQDMYNYSGLEVTGSMKTIEDGRWVKIEELQNPRRLTNSEPTEITIIQSDIKLFMTYDNQIWSSNLEDVTEALNTKHELNEKLTRAMKYLK